MPSCFSLLVLSIHNHHINGGHVMVSPMVCTAIQPMSCAIHLSLQHNHTLTLASPHNRHTPCGKCHHSECQTLEQLPTVKQVSVRLLLSGVIEVYFQNNSTKQCAVSFLSQHEQESQMGGKTQPNGHEVNKMVELSNH